MCTGTEIYTQAMQALEHRAIPIALECFTRAEAQGWAADECAAGRWECYMLLGEFEKAWRESDAIAARGQPDEHRLWNGPSFKNRKLIVRCLHGLGDAIQFLRYVPLVRREAAQVIVEGPKRIMPLVETMPGVDAVVSWEFDGQTYPEWDQQIEITELPRAYRTTLATIPSEVPYLFPCPASEHGPATKHAYRKRLLGSRPKVGIVWAASTWNTARSMKLAELAPLLQIPGIEFCALQAGPDRDQLYELNADLMLADLTGEMNDLLETARFLLDFDLLISVDTMMAHLAGALGIPVWLLLTRTADWRWMLDRADSPWYPSMRLFRQIQTGDWSPVLLRLTEALENLANVRSTSR